MFRVWVLVETASFFAQSEEDKLSIDIKNHPIIVVTVCSKTNATGVSDSVKAFVFGQSEYQRKVHGQWCYKNECLEAVWPGPSARQIRINRQAANTGLTACEI